MGHRYQVAGGRTEEVTCILNALEEVYPLSLLSRTQIAVYQRHFRKGYIKVQGTADMPTLWLLTSRRQWVKYYGGPVKFEPFCKIAAKYGVVSYHRASFYIAISVAHEWYHLIELEKGKRNVLDKKVMLQSEINAERWAWKFVAKHWPMFLPKQSVPLAIRRRYRTYNARV